MKTLILILLLIAGTALSAPFDTGMITWTQPNGSTTFSARLWGDEFAWYDTTSTGYAIINTSAIWLNTSALSVSRGWYVYAQLDANGEYTTTTDTVGIQSARAGSLRLTRSVGRLAVIDTLVGKRVTQYETNKKISSHSRSTYSSTLIGDSVTRVKIGLVFFDFPDQLKFRSAKRPNGWKASDFTLMVFDTVGGYFDTTTADGTPRYDSSKVFGSLADYYWDMSCRKLRLTGSIANPTAADTIKYITMPNVASYYGGNPNEAVTRIYEMLDTARVRGYIDTSYQYFFVIQAGTGVVYNHAWNYVFPIGNNGYFKPYISIGELTGVRATSNLNIQTIGIMAHEFGHDLGFSDEYLGVGFGEGTTAGVFDAMALGSSNSPNGSGVGVCPAPINPFYRLEKGWITAQYIPSNAINFTISYNYSYPAYHLNLVNPWNQFRWNGNAGGITGNGGVEYPDNYGTYFLIETRLKTGFDLYTPNIPGDGFPQYGNLLIWRSQKNDGVELVSADTSAPNSPLSFWPGIVGNLRSFTPATTPATRYPIYFTGIRQVGNTTVINSIQQSLDTSVVVTDSATNVQLTTATLNGYANITGILTGVGFVWDNDRNLTSGDSLLAAESPINSFSIVHRDITGLTSNTKYFYRAIACNINGGQVGNLDSLTTQTAATKPTVTASAAALITNTTAQANGLVNPNGATTTVIVKLFNSSSVYINQATVATLNTNLTTPQAVLRSLTGLSASTTYGFKVLASNSAGSDSTSIAQFTTAANPVAVPTVTTNAITNLGLSSPIPYSTGTLLYSVTVNPNGGVTTVVFDWGTTTGVYPFTTTVSTTLNGTTSQTFTFIATGLLLNTTYYVRGRASNGAGSVNGSPVTATTNVAVPVITTASASNIGLFSVTFGGTTHTGGASTVDSFLIGTSSGVYPVRLPSDQSPISAGQVAVTVSKSYSLLAQATTHYFVHKAKNSAGTVTSAESTFITSQITLVPPTVSLLAPLSLSATSERLRGLISTNTLSTLVLFWYIVPIGNVGFDTVFVDNGSISGNQVNVTEDISGLRDSYTYTWGIRATNSGGTTQAVSTFTTGSAATSGRFIITK